MACGSKAHEPQTHRVAIRAMHFEPASLELSGGDVVVWTNEDIVPHTATAAGTFDSQSLTSKREWRYTAAKAGEYAYGCTFHPTMKGTLTVR
jgi:plastocyanin